MDSDEAGLSLYATNFIVGAKDEYASGRCARVRLEAG
jgi:hypothetical protein